MESPKIIVGVVVAAFCSSLSAQWIINPATGSEYQVLPPMTWQAAQAAAEAEGAHLAVIDDAAENQWVVDNLLFWSSYIGGTDAAVEGVWTTPSGDPLVYSNWAPGQPDDFQGGEDYLVMWMANPPSGITAGMWNDEDGVTPLFSIIERPARLLTEHFEDPTLDPAKWQVVTQGVPGSPAVYLQSGECVLENRGYLRTVQSFDATTIGAYRVECRWRADSQNEYFQVHVRSDGVPAGVYGEAQNGVGIGAWYEQGGAFVPSVRGTDVVMGSWTTSGPGVSPQAGVTYAATITDYGWKIHLRVEGPDPVSEWFEAEAVVLSDASAERRVVFYNREQMGVSHRSYLDDVVITSVGPVASYQPFGAGCPDPANAVPVLLAPAGEAPRVGTTSTLRVEGLPTTPTVPVFVLGFSDTQAGGPGGSYALPLDLGILGWPGCEQLVSVDDTVYSITTTGAAEHQLTIPPFPFLVGSRFYAQALVLYTGSGVAVTNGIAARAGW